MTPQALLKQQFGGIHDILEQTIADCSQHTLDMNLPNATITNIGSIYAHIIFSEDGIVQGMLQKKPPVYQSQGWASRLNVHMPANPQFDPAWGRAVRMDLPSFREYAKAVYAATDAYVSGLSPADLERKVETGFVGTQTVGFVLGNICVWHVAEHNGEIGALKGAQGLKGLPF
jgi:DinB family protein